MRIAECVASRATCDRKHVGAVVVRDRCILATGYNGSVRGMPHCDDEGHMMEGGHCVRTVHAEANAIIQAARNGVRVEGATVYVTAPPCWGCFKMIANAGLARIVSGEFSRDERISRLATEIGIELSAWSTPRDAAAACSARDVRAASEAGGITGSGLAPSSDDIEEET